MTGLQKALQDTAVAHLYWLFPLLQRGKKENAIIWILTQSDQFHLNMFINTGITVTIGEKARYQKKLKSHKMLSASGQLSLTFNEKSKDYVYSKCTLLLCREQRMDNFTNPKL